MAEQPGGDLLRQAAEAELQDQRTGREPDADRMLADLGELAGAVTAPK
ncbi:hypothetical protein ABTX35_39970 [Streptomyces sp. NPDC096080]